MTFDDLIEAKTEPVYPVDMCPQCGALGVEEYSIMAADISFYYKHCEECGFRWTMQDV